MTNHQMRLHPRPFEQVKAGTKTIEIRINDEKRQGLAVGDQIEFISRTNPDDRILTQVTDLTYFQTFAELFASIPPEQYGGGSVDQMYEHYSPKDEKNFGVVGIQFKPV